MHDVTANGARIPAIGLGTWELRGAKCVEIVAAGLAMGYRHIDTAQAYGNEREVGAAMRAGGVARGDIFLTTKAWFDRLAPGDLEASAEESLARLGTDYVDLLLIHWPNPAFPLADSLGALARVKQRGLARHIGISNFTVAMVDEAVRLCPEPLVTNQVEYHPFLDAHKVMAACRRNGLSLTAYCPLARGRVVGETVIEEIAARHGRTAGQVALRWLVQQPGVIAIPRTSSTVRLAENLDVFGFSLSEAEMAAVSGLARPDGRVVQVSWAPDWD